MLCCTWPVVPRACVHVHKCISPYIRSHTPLFRFLSIFLCITHELIYTRNYTHNTCPCLSIYFCARLRVTLWRHCVPWLWRRVCCHVRYVHDRYALENMEAWALDTASVYALTFALIKFTGLIDAQTYVTSCSLPWAYTCIHMHYTRHCIAYIEYIHSYIHTCVSIRTYSRFIRSYSHVSNYIQI